MIPRNLFGVCWLVPEEFSLAGLLQECDSLWYVGLTNICDRSPFHSGRYAVYRVRFSTKALPLVIVPSLVIFSISQASKSLRADCARIRSLLRMDPLMNQQIRSPVEYLRTEWALEVSNQRLHAYVLFFEVSLESGVSRIAGFALLVEALEPPVAKSVLPSNELYPLIANDLDVWGLQLRLIRTLLDLLWALR